MPNAGRSISLCSDRPARSAVALWMCCGIAGATQSGGTCRPLPDRHSVDPGTAISATANCGYRYRRVAADRIGRRFRKKPNCSSAKISWRKSLPHRKFTPSSPRLSAPLACDSTWAALEAGKTRGAGEQRNARDGRPAGDATGRAHRIAKFCRSIASTAPCFNACRPGSVTK